MMAGLPETNIRLRATLYYGTDAPMNDDSRPVYLKLRDLIAAGIIEGHYREGEMLPSVRAFAAEQGANPLTVAKAYSQFQADGLIDVQRDHIRKILEGANWRVRGIGGAADRLGLRPTTLETRMAKLGLSRPRAV